MVNFVITQEYKCIDNCKRKDCEVCYNENTIRLNLPDNLGERFLKLCVNLEKKYKKGE